MLAKTLLLLLPMSLALASPVTNLAKRTPYAQFTVSQAFTTLAKTSPFATVDNGIGFFMQLDGNFVVYKNGGAAAVDALWSSNTGGHDCTTGNCWLVWQTDGNLVVYVKGGKAAWASNTAGRGYRLYLSNQQPYITIYGSNGNAVWSTPRPVGGGGGTEPVGGGGGGGVDPCKTVTCVIVYPI